MSGFKSVEGNFADFKRLFPLSGALASTPGAIAAWMDACASYCGLPCAERTTPELDRLSKLICQQMQYAVRSNNILRQALALTFYPFESAKDVIWAIWALNVPESFALRDHETDQMQALSKGDALELARNTQKVLAWRAEIALRHGGDYKLALERMMEPVSGFGELAEMRLQRQLANQQIRLLTQMRNRPAFRR